jgi:hypothetical protein
MADPMDSHPDPHCGSGPNHGLFRQLTRRPPKNSPKKQFIKKTNYEPVMDKIQISHVKWLEGKFRL